MRDLEQQMREAADRWGRTGEVPDMHGWADAIARLTQERDKAVELAEQLKLQAQAHAQEARTQRGTVHECYQAVGFHGATWHGAEPICRFKAEADAALLVCQQERKKFENANVLMVLDLRAARAQLGATYQALHQLVEEMRYVLSDLDRADVEGVMVDLEARHLLAWADRVAALLPSAGPTKT